MSIAVVSDVCSEDGSSCLCRLPAPVQETLHYLTARAIFAHCLQ